MKSTLLGMCLLVGICSAAFGEGAAPATQPAQPVNKVCPISGDKVDPDVTCTYEGKTVGFCCKDCIADFKKNPEKYTKNLK